MKLSSTLIVLFRAAARVANAEELDLFVREKFEGECASCEEGAGCYLKSRAFFVQRSCFNRNDQKASVYDEVEEGVVCRQDFGASCVVDNAFSAASVDDCKDSWNLDECTESEHMTKLGGWCTLSSDPVGEFITPLLSFKEYDSVDACGSNDYAHLMLADEGGACVPLSFKGQDGEYITGSRKVSCDGGVFGAARYVSADCTGDAQRTYTDGSSDECPADAEGSRIYTNDCGAPAIYCKASSYFAGESEKSDAEAAMSDPVAAPPSSAGRHAVVGGLLVMGMALISWVA
eukprot:CAMPEP_0172531988 /NCGR_PEP_ID=MMETSP1067-20121228/5200_1 /TAXON_ID=265564 ORGANISM="Thalassiosira punctigera, Strain Tpunct2005C2" /NCGR_SAMPLE_ID=MMETSP1067 /ASSEMBLY_ACC=CAM_ASM_000444 /LENGTH=288 /DNA_ID=CAMNT_0013316441 /DNA_START=37 /DNA_END=903 /DNA_ORIENTATION=-